MLLPLLLVTFARADYFDVDRQIRNEEYAREAAAVEATARGQVAQHNAQLSAFVARFANTGHGGAFNVRPKRCEDFCLSDNGLRNREDWVEQMTFTTGDGYECYAEVFPAGHAVHCVNPQTRARIDDDKVGDRVAAEIERKSRRYKKYGRSGL